MKGIFFSEGSLVEPMLKIVILWRRDGSHVKYEWLNDKWESSYDFNDSFHKLESSITRLLKANEALSYEGFIKVWFALLEIKFVHRIFWKWNEPWMHEKKYRDVHCLLMLQFLQLFWRCLGRTRKTWTGQNFKFIFCRHYLTNMQKVYGAGFSPEFWLLSILFTMELEKNRFYQ